MHLSKNMIRIVTGVVVLAVVAVSVVYLTAGGNSKKLTAYFASGVGVYPGTPVKVLGIQVGSVTKVTPDGGAVRIEMKYDDKYRLPRDASAFLVANSLVSDRYVQLAPAYTEGAVLPSNASIPLERTASPAELDDIYSALNQLSIALGPNGANSKGALSTLIDVAAANLQGNGKALSTSVKNLSKAVQTLSSGRTDLFGTVTNLRKLTDALNESDQQVAHFQTQLAQVAGDLADERADLGAALHNLTIALHDVANFVQTNAAKVHTDIVGLKDLTNILVKEKAAINEALVAGPVALANLTHGYQEPTGTLGTRSNLAGLTDPKNLAGQLCQIVAATFSTGLGKLLLGELVGQTLSAGCSKLSGSSSSASGLSALTDGLTGGTG